MKYPIIIIATLVIFSSLLITETSFGQDPAQVSPEIFKVILENDQVRVMEYQIKPGQRDAFHSHPQQVAYALSPAKIRVTSTDGTITEFDLQPGDAIWQEPVTHYSENVGNNAAKILVVEIKQQQSRSTIPLKQTDPWGSPW